MGWAIFGGIVGGIGLIVFILLMLPLHVVLKTEKDGSLQLYFRILGIAFGKEAKPGNPVTKALERLVGLSQFKSAESAKENAGKEPVGDTVRRMFHVLTSLAKRAAYLVKHCTVSRLHLQVVCAGEDAAETAVEYGVVSGVVYSLYGYLDSVAKIRKRAVKLNITCDYEEKESKVEFEAVLFLRIHRIIKALLDMVKDNVEKEIYR